MIIEGALSVKAVLESKRRDCIRLIIGTQKKGRDVRYIESLAESVNCPVEFVSRAECDALAVGKTHGSILLECGYRHSDPLTAQVIRSSPIVLCLEGINDPFNFGQICRNAYAFGVNLILCDDYHFKDSEATVVKASAGASERLAIVSSAALASDLGFLKSQQVTLYSAARFEDSLVLGQDVLDVPCCICIGGEMRGLSKAVLDQCAHSVMIAYPNSRSRVSLTAVNASSVFLYELNRRKGESS